MKCPLVLIMAALLSVAAGKAVAGGAASKAAGGGASQPPPPPTTSSSSPTSSSLTSPAAATNVGAVSAEQSDAEEARGSAAIKALQELVLMWAVNQVRARLKSTSEFNANEKNDVRLNDVLGCDEAKHELSQILEFIKHPEVRSALMRSTARLTPPQTHTLTLAPSFRLMSSASTSWAPRFRRVCFW